MAYNDYVVMIDENGQPYIAHAMPWKKTPKAAAGQGEERPGHKYVGRLWDGTKWLYAYSQEALNALRRGGGRVKAKVKDKLGYDERERRDAAWNNMAAVNSTLKNAPSYLPGAQNMRTAAQNEYNRAQDEYSKTALGKYEHLKATLKVRGQLAADTIKRYGKTTLAAIRSLPSRISSDIQRRRNNRNIRNAVRDAAPEADERGTVRTNAYWTPDNPAIERRQPVATSTGPAIERRQPKQRQPVATSTDSAIKRRSPRSTNGATQAK